VRLSCAEIRQLFWQLVLAVERSAAAILRWSCWRRWHQAWARYYHYRRRQSAATEREKPEGEARQGVARQIDVTEVVWRRLEQLLPPAHRVGHPYDYSRRLVLEAIVHLMQTDCGWRNLPSRFPPWQTVHTQLTQWRKTGIWNKIWSGLEQPHPTDELQL
jgi:transposase